MVDTRANGAAAQEQAAQLPDAMALTPHKARARRDCLLAMKAAEDQERRTIRRAAAKEQVRAGVRPKRHKPQRAEISVCSVNANSAETLRRELAAGGELAQCDYLAVQETKIGVEQMTAATDWMRKARWGGALDQAYWKKGGYGGGTGILTRHPAGIKHVAVTVGKLCGRVTVGTTCFGPAIAIISFYGLSGGSLTAQLPYWKELIDLLLKLGLPFIVAGDWQRPQETCAPPAFATCSTRRCALQPVPLMWPVATSLISSWFQGASSKRVGAYCQSTAVRSGRTYPWSCASRSHPRPP